MAPRKSSRSKRFAVPRPRGCAIAQEPWCSSSRGWWGWCLASILNWTGASARRFNSWPRWSRKRASASWWLHSLPSCSSLPVGCRPAHLNVFRNLSMLRASCRDCRWSKMSETVHWKRRGRMCPVHRVGSILATTSENVGSVLYKNSSNLCVLLAVRSTKSWAICQAISWRES